MSTVFPARIDDSTTLPTAVDNASLVRSKVVNDLRDAILAIENALGVKPQGVYGTVRSRFDAIEAAILTIDETLANIGSGSSVVVLGGDLGGGSISQTVVGLQGNNVSPIPPTDGYVLTWSSSSDFWLPQPAPIGFLANGDLSGNVFSQKVIGLQGRPVLNSLPTDGYALVYSAIRSQWEPTHIASGGGGVATGMQRVFSTANMGKMAASNWAGGNFTAGWKFGIIGLAVNCIGMKFWAQFSDGLTKSIVCNLQDGTGTILKTATVSAVSGTVVDVTWDSISLAPNSNSTWYAVTCFESTGTYYIDCASPTPNIPGENGGVQPNIFWGSNTGGWPWFFNQDSTVHIGFGKFRSGNQPIQNAGNYSPFQSEFYAVEPKFS